MGSWILFIFLATGNLTVVYFDEFEPCLAAQRGVNTVSENLYLPDRQMHAYCFPAKVGLALEKQKE